MKFIKSNIKQFIHSLIVIIVSLSIVFSAGVFFKSFSYYEVVKYFIFGFAILIPIVVILGFISQAHNKRVLLEKYNLITQNYERREGIIADILIIKKFRRKNHSCEAIFSFFPIIKDLNSDKFYLSIGEKLTRKYGYSYQGKVFSTLEYKLLNSYSEEVKVGDHAYFYIKEEVGEIFLNDKTFDIDGVKYTYYGKINDTKLMHQKGDFLVFNESSDDFINTLNNSILFEGVVEFDNEPFENLL